MTAPILGAVDDGLTDVEEIRDRVRSNVKTFANDQENAADDAIDRFVEKRILEREGTTVRHR